VQGWSKHVENWNKYIGKKKNFASSWLFTRISNDLYASRRTNRSTWRQTGRWTSSLCIYKIQDTYSFRRTLLKNSIVEICSKFSSGTDGFSNHEVLGPAASATLRNSSYCSGRAKQAGVTGREKRAGRTDSWLAVLHRPERLQRTLWIPGIRLTRCNGPMSWNSVLEKHSGSPSEKAKHSRRVQLVRRSATRSQVATRQLHYGVKYRAKEGWILMRKKKPGLVNF
jgi:hypothetical protein